MRRRLFIAAALSLLLVLVACDPLATPTGPAPLRYRDDVFSSVTKTANITYGTAVDQTSPTPPVSGTLIPVR